ncbi:sigma-70 family RNA polymerase sigma factor [Glaciibacter flavus]|uniref:Sigma-70 family RNA polymerase sigma factor n=1 Tax=Orlajensenia flava TaxID=2565934 RepID=A0A4S4FUH6_9MICO|nr:sigma-70 family RNA polymerase sigma factor [Glaciibacter flavus]THG34510.1 sigma-70 family RNA polymerase sigma factor [Glaciibacter flavus]
MFSQSATDGELISLASRGDQQAFGTLFDRHAEVVARYAWAFRPDAADVQDLVQETFSTAWANRASVSIVDSSLLPWLLAVCRNHARNLARKRAKEAHLELPADFAHPAEREHLGERERLRWVMSEIEKLGDIDRRICELCLIEGVPYNNAAASVGVSPAALAKRVERIRVKLRRAVMES